MAQPSRVGPIQAAIWTWPSSSAKPHPRPTPIYELVGELQALSSDHEVDGVRLDGADPLLLKKVTEGCELLYGSSRRLQELKLYAFTRYQDYRRFLALERDYVRRKVATRRWRSIPSSSRER
jgi:hypothetical protein